MVRHLKSNFSRIREKLKGDDFTAKKPKTTKPLTWKQKLITYIIGGLPVAWFALILAPCTDAGNLFLIAEEFNIAFQKPFSITWVDQSLKTILIMEAIYALALLYYETGKKKYRKGEEYGSAAWTTPDVVSRELSSIVPEENRILSDLVRVDVDSRKVNLNTCVVGGSGAGKTWRYVKPNLMQANTSFVVLDPKGENLKDTGALLEAHGYEVRVLNLLDMTQSDHYNPFEYLTDENSIQNMITTIFKATSAEGGGGGDMKFWEDSAEALLSALVYYLWDFTPKEDQNFAAVMELIRKAKVDEDHANAKSIVDGLFDELEENYPNHIALKYWQSYRVGSAKTLKSIQSTLTSHLAKFNLNTLEELTSYDELNIRDLGNHKVALFALIPDMDTSFNFLVSVLYSQLFQELERVADAKDNKRLNVPVHFLMDEFANVALPKDFDKILSVIRSRGISVSIILQNITQLKTLYKDSWESIIGNCDEFVYLGGNEQSTHEYVSKLLGKETINYDTTSRTKGTTGSYSTNFQFMGRELMTSDEVGSLSDEYEIMRIRGQGVIIDKKFDPHTHPNFSEFNDKGSNPYVWKPKEEAIRRNREKNWGKSEDFVVDNLEFLDSNTITDDMDVIDLDVPSENDPDDDGLTIAEMIERMTVYSRDDLIKELAEAEQDLYPLRTYPNNNPSRGRGNNYGK